MVNATPALFPIIISATESPTITVSWGWTESFRQIVKNCFGVGFGRVHLSRAEDDIKETVHAKVIEDGFRILSLVRGGQGGIESFLLLSLETKV